MHELHFIVYFRDGSWQSTSRGDITAHFASRDEAIRGAIDAAVESGEQHARVIVQETNTQQETVWQQAQSSEG